MKMSQLNEWLSLLANFGVVIGIAFLIIEISQNTAQLESDARSTRASEVISLRLFASENQTMFASDECGQDLNLWMDAVFEIQMWQYLETGMPNYLIERYRGFRRSIPCLDARWESNKFGFHPDFVAYMDENVYN